MLIKIHTIYKGGATFYSYASDENSLLRNLEEIFERLVRYGIVNLSEFLKRGYTAREYSKEVVRDFLINGTREFKFSNVTIKIEPIEWKLSWALTYENSC